MILHCFSPLLFHHLSHQTNRYGVLPDMQANALANVSVQAEKRTGGTATDDNDALHLQFHSSATTLFLPIRV